MAAMLACPHCGAEAMKARDKLLWLYPSRAIPCARCGARLSLAFRRWTAGAIPLYLLLILVFAGLLRSWLLILPAAALTIGLFLIHKVYAVPLVPARRSASTAAPWRLGRKR